MGQHPDPGSDGDPVPEPPASDGGSPASPASPASGGPSREEVLAGFAKGGAFDARPPDPELAAAIVTAAGPGWRCKGASGEQMIGILNRIAAQEAWMAAAKLGVIRALIRDDDPAFLCKSRHGDLPDVWEPALAHEVALALAASAPSADKVMQTAWQLQARLPEIGALLEQGVIDAAKARMITEVFAELNDEDAGAAEEMLVRELTEPPAKTYTQVERAATAIALIVDPHHGEERRKAAEKRDARVRLYRERAGTAAVEGRDLPVDQALAAYANATARATQYQDSGRFGKAGMDRLRATAFLDLLTGVSAEARIECGLLSGQEPDPEPQPETAGAPGRPGGDDCPCAKCDGACLPPDDSPDEPDPDGPDDNDPDDPSSDNNNPDDGQDDGDPGDHDPGNGVLGDDGQDGDPGDRSPETAVPDPVGPCDSSDHGDRPDRAHPGRGGNRPSDIGPDDNRPPGGDNRPPGRSSERDNASGGNPGPQPATPLPPASPVGTRAPTQELILPLATLAGLAARPGEGHGLGALDPELCRTLAATATASPHTTLCVTVTNADGIAIGHGCAKPARPATPAPAAGPPENRPPPPRPLVALPSRINLTITEGQLGALAHQTQTGWALAPSGIGPPTRTGPPALSIPPAPSVPSAPPVDPDWCRTWDLTLPDGRLLIVRLEPVPTFDCDHRNESHAYQPNGKLRHLVQVRDYVCTFPTCNRHARDSDFEHAVPYDKGGRTCACNAGVRSRQCHQVKQAPGWNVTQPKPGWHAWSTPRGRTYTQGPNRYPV